MKNAFFDQRSIQSRSRNQTPNSHVMISSFFLQNGPILTFRLNSHILKIEILLLVNF